MKGKWVLALALLAQTTLSHADGRLIGLPETADGMGWVEVSIPVAKNGGFTDAIDQQKTSGVGAGLNVGYRPFLKAIQDDDQFLVKLLKSVGFEANIQGLSTKPGFDQYLYSVYNNVAVSSETYSYTCTDQYGYWNGNCFACYSSSGYCHTEATGVYARDTYVKYSNGSVSIGAYLPITIARKLTIEGGAAIRFHFVREGIQTDALTNTIERSLDAVIKVGYNINDRWNIGVSAAKSVLGFDSKQIAVYVRYSW